MRPISHDLDLNAAERTIIIKRNDMVINEKECQVVNFIDITTYKRLEQEKETNELLRTLNTTVHHEMLAPLRANISFCRKLLEKLYQDQWATRII